MANINVKDLSSNNISGANLFDDSESFMMELSDESDQVIGGKGVIVCPWTCVFTAGGSSGTIIVVFAK